MMTSFSRGPLPPAPQFCSTAQLTDCGIVLGEGVVVAPLSRCAHGAAALAVEGREAEIFALLSLAGSRAIHPNVLHGLRSVAKRVAWGDNVGAAIRLAQIGLPPLRGPRDAEMLKAGAIFLGKGFSPWTILQAAAIQGANVRLFKAEWNEDLHPRDAAGRFASTGGSGVIAASVAEQLIAGGAMQISAGVFALAGGALLSLTAAGWVLSNGPKGDIQDGASYWLPGVSSNEASDEDGKDETPGLGHNGGPALDRTGEQQPQNPNQKPEPSIVTPLTSPGSGDNDATQQSGNEAIASNNSSCVGEPKIAWQMGIRGWTSDSIRSTLASPAETVSTRDTRFDERSGVRRNDPATAYVNSDGSYVVVNDMDRTVVQLSDRNNPNWRAPWTKGNP